MDEMAAASESEPTTDLAPAFVDEPDPDYWAIAIKQFPNLTRTEWPPLRNIIEEAFMLGYNAKQTRQPKAPREPKAPRQPRADSKQAQVITMMQRPEGATVAQIAEATNWQPHTIRAFISTAKKKKGLEIATNHLRNGVSGSITTYFIN
ncbi:MAG: DUF3489 domain-containing protein [Magnetococcales bacterium]|nr:DUF3489 domain-containing protein [Magnetococcales bacterium]